MFSPIGKKRIILKNYQHAKQTGRPVEEIARESFNESFSMDGSVGLSRSFSSFGGFRSMSSIGSLEDGADGEEKRIRKKRSKHKKYLNQKILEESLKADETPLGTALKKLTTSAAHFRKDRDGIMLAGFETKSLDREEFRLMLRKVLFLEFNDSEYDECFRLFDTDEVHCIDGCEFLVYFTHLGTLYKERVRSKQLKRQQEHEEREKRKRDDVKRRLQNKKDNAVDFNYTAEDAATADAKLRAAAKLYDRSSASAKSVRAFESNYLNPLQFRSLCLQTFDLKLTTKEVGVIVDKYDTADNHKVDSSFFLTQFLRLGVQERHLDRSKQIILTRQSSQKHIEEHNRKVEEMERRLESGLEGVEFSMKDQEIGMEKLRVAAMKFDKGHPSSLSLDGFCSVYSSPGVFREMLRRTFNLILPLKESVAVIKYFDTENNGSVNNSAFLTYFRRASTGGRFSQRSDMLARKHKAEEDAAAEKERLLREQWGKLEDKVKYEFTANDKKSAVKKLTDLAKKYFADRSADAILKPFKVAHMGPAMWRDMMKRTFFIQLSDGELAYFISVLKDDEMNIDCKKFLVQFNSMVFDERAKARTHQLALDRERALEAKRKEEALIVKKKRLNELSIDFHYNDHDMESCLSKFRLAAMRHDKSHSGSVSLSAFEVASMPAMDFKELCRRVFRIELTAKELGAIVTLCGKATVGVSPIKKIAAMTTNDVSEVHSSSDCPAEPIRPFTTQSGRNNNFIECNCNEFMILFSYLQRMEKHSVFSRRCSLFQNLKRMKAAEHEKIMGRELQNNVRLTQFTELDAESMMRKINEACQKFTVDSAAYLTEMMHFKGPCITPPSFRDIFFKIFLIRLTFPEVGALCHQLNPELNQEFLINGNNFLTSFYKLSRIHEKILLGMPTSEDIHSASVLKLATDFEILPADRPRSTIEKSGRISELAKCPSIDKGVNSQSRATRRQNSSESSVTRQSCALPTPGDNFSPISQKKQSSSFPSAKLPTLKQLESKLQAVEKKSEELGDMFLKKHTNRDGFTKEYALVLRERDELVARINYREYREE